MTKASAPSGTVDRSALLALLHEENFTKLAQAMQIKGHSPDEIMGALWDENSRQPSPLDEERLDAIVARCIEDYRKGYAPRLIQVPMSGFMRKEYPAPRFIVDNLIPRNEVTLAGGHGGSGKSMLFLALAAHVASGKSWADFEVEQCRVVFVSLEDQGDHVMYRLQKIISEYLLDIAQVEANLQVIDGTSHPELMIEVNEYGTHTLQPTQTMQEIERTVAGAGLIIIDNASDAYGGNENERRGVRRFIHHLAGIARANNAAVVVLAHIDKAAARHGGNGNSYSGSTAWHNSTRSRLALLEVDGQLQLHHEKFNRSRQAEPVPLMWTDDGVVVPGKSASAAAARAKRAQADNDAALQVMRAAQSLDLRVPAAASGPVTSWSVVSHLPAMDAFQGKDGKRRFHSALHALSTDGLLIRQDYRTDQRKTRTAWELTAKGEQVTGNVVP